MDSRVFVRHIFALSAACPCVDRVVGFGGLLSIAGPRPGSKDRRMAAHFAAVAAIGLYVIAVAWAVSWRLGAIGRR